ncbi:unnamed protein product, partial [Porites lobata]
MRLRLRQLRVPEDDLLGEAIAEAFRQGYHDVKLAKQLNSAEDLDATKGEFYVEMTFSSGCGGKNGGKKGNPGWMSYEKLLKKRGCIIQIKNRDELCCARAIVTLKARVDKDPEYQNIMQGRGVQGW